MAIDPKLAFYYMDIGNVNHHPSEAQHHAGVLPQTTLR